MSINGLQNTNLIINTIDGLTNIWATDIYENGQKLSVAGLVPYTGANQMIDLNNQTIRTTHTPSNNADLINLETLTNAVTFVDNSVSLTYLNKITTTPQTVDGKVTFNKELAVINNKKTNLSSKLVVDSNYKSNLTSGSITATQGLGTITNVGIVYEVSTTSTNPGILNLFPITAGTRYRFSIELLGGFGSTTTYLQTSQSEDGINPYTSGIIDVRIFPNGSTDYETLDYTFEALTNGYVIIEISTDDPSGITGLKWKNFTTYNMGVYLDNITTTITASKVPIINDKQQLVSSGVDSIKITYLDNVSSDIQTQLNNKVDISTLSDYALLAGNNTFTGNNQFQNGNTTTTGITSFKNNSACDIDKGYELNAAFQTSTFTRRLGRISFLRNAGGTDYSGYMGLDVSSDGALYKRMLTLHKDNGVSAGANKITTTYTAVNNEDVVNKGSLNTVLGSYLPLSGGILTGDLTMNSNYVNCSNDPTSNNQLTRKKYVDDLIISRIPRTGDTSLIGDYQTSGTITAAGLVSTGGIRGTAFLTSSAVIEYNRTSDRGKWFKIINVGTGPNTYYGEFHITYAVAGEHAHIHFIVSGMYNAAPNIKVLHSTIYGGSVVQYLRIALDNASIYYQGFVEMYLADFSWYEANINIYVYGINNAPLNSYYSLINTKTAGTSSGYSYYAVDTAVGFDMNYAGTRYKMGNTIFYTNAPTTIDGTLSTPARIAITNGDPGDLISKRYGGSGDRYGIGQYSSGTVRMFGSNAYGNTSLRFSLATDDVTTGAAAFKDLMTMRYNGVLDIKGGNGGDWAYQYLTRAGGLIIGRIDTDYGGEYQTNNNNVAGFMMECLDQTEIQIHDAGQRLASFMFYRNNNFTIGRDSGYGVTSTLIAGFLNVTNTQQISTGANQNFLTLYANSNNSTEYINLRFSHQGNSTYIQSYRTSGFWRTYLLFNTVNASGGSVTMFQITDQGIMSYGSFYTAGNAWCGDSTTLGNGCSNFSQGWDRCLIYANGYSTGGGYFYYNQGNAYGTISDRRIKKDFEKISQNQSVAFIQALEPTSFCLKEQKTCTRKTINDKGEEIEDEICPAVCSCRQDGWIAQNVLEACKVSGASKSVVNNWYDYEQELKKPEEEQKTLIGVSDRPILSHTVNVVKHLLNENETLKEEIKQLKDIIYQHNELLKKISERLK